MYLQVIQKRTPILSALTMLTPEVKAMHFIQAN